eukprot:CAMPEP_0113941086 /NCGR_PEP_ID=MMETSP1339-20121228/7083_1 /TAXON_ID=94617 /ORGANISM="Fibrocapsa japonica" /LENGTH=444 /DNA_ID=CAMNT_0000945131 /DNA_START=120 /DNA_END=1455 /DNA_ORIENTATION=+ /assembly_acc=CAM_ASM_000762
MNDGMLPEEWEKEREVELLEEAVARADLSTQKPWKLPVAGIRVQTLKEAAAARDRLTSLHMDDMAAVLRINADFYQAFLDRNIDSMRTLWMDSDDVICIHPGAELVGYNNIVSAWEKAFAASKKDSTAALDPFFSGAVIGGQKIFARGTTAYVSCVEEVRLEKVKQGPQQQQGQQQQADSTLLLGSGTGPNREHLQATNIFQKAGGRWYLVHRHCSREVAGATAGAESGGSTQSISLNQLLSGQVISLGPGGSTSQIAAALQGQDVDLESLRNIVRRRIQGQQLDDDEDDESSDDDEVSFTVREVGGQKVIMASREAADETAEDDNNDEDSTTRMSPRALQEASAVPKEESTKNDKHGTMDLTGETIAAIRKLHKQNRITLEEKRCLLTDVIKHAFNEDPASVEMAFDLLIGDMSEETWKDEESVEEFADQCRMIADEIQQQSN